MKTMDELKQEKLSKMLRKLPGDMRVCNCAGCGTLMASKRDAVMAKRRRLQTVHQYVRERPFCETCILLGVHATDQRVT